MRFFTKIHNYLCTLFVFAVIYILYLIPTNLELLDPVGKALSDFEMTDLVFSELRDNPTPDTNIVLVNIGMLNRSEIGELISNLNKHDPAIIGIDAFFSSKKDFDKDIRLIMSMGQTKNLVLVSELMDPREDGSAFDSLRFSHPQFNNFATNGYANFIAEGEGGFRTTRNFPPFFMHKDTLVPAFASHIVKLFDEDAYKTLEERKNPVETINWFNNHKGFMRLEYQDVLNQNFEGSLLEGKIVLLGMLGRDYIGQPGLDDVFYTPLNEHPAGRAYPDMYGVTVHANIISMILQEKYIETLPMAINFGLAVILVFLNVSLFMWVGEKYKIYYDLITKGLILIEVAILFSINLISLFYFSYKVDLTIAIVCIIFSGDLTELYVGSLRDISVNLYHKLKPMFGKKTT